MSFLESWMGVGDAVEMGWHRKRSGFADGSYNAKTFGFAGLRAKVRWRDASILQTFSNYSAVKYV